MQITVYVYKYDGDTKYVTSNKQELLNYLKREYYYEAQVDTEGDIIEKELEDEWEGMHEINEIEL